MAKILLVEDDYEIASLVVDCLKAQNYLVDHLVNGSEALDRLKFFEYDLIILDWKLPGTEGVEVCNQFRARGGKTPCMILTGMRELENKEQGLDAGADDYLTKPFQPRELTARIRALLRRPAMAETHMLVARDLELDTITHIVTKAGQEVQLLPKEFALLEFLMRHPRQVFSAEALIDRVWSSDSEATGTAVRINVNRLRRKIDSSDQESCIRTIHGVGYRFDP
ncbi:MAG: response regulator transcription factor [Candidatus Obscuribacterales bacterium]|nr:response regulator transcription factor [Candidatus Obscuribacterales bacterium]